MVLYFWNIVKCLTYHHPIIMFSLIQPSRASIRPTCTATSSTPYPLFTFQVFREPGRGNTRGRGKGTREDAPTSQAFRNARAISRAVRWAEPLLAHTRAIHPFDSRRLGFFFIGDSTCLLHDAAVIAIVHYFPPRLLWLRDFFLRTRDSLDFFGEARVRESKATF